jgi:hypothetical protein
MNSISRRCSSLVLLMVVSVGCSQDERDFGPRYETTALSGFVHVDEEPATGVMVECHPEPGSSELKAPLIALTNEDGHFAFGLYEQGGGVPAGKYRLVFRWELLEHGMKDKLNGVYADPKDSKFPITIEFGEPVDLGIVELTTNQSAG